MSINERTDMVIGKEPVTRWADETVSGYSVDISNADISELEYDTTGLECRSKQISDIWEPDTVWLNLQSLPGAEAIEELIKMEKIDDVLAHPNGLTTGLFLSTWMNNKMTLKAILDKRGDPKIVDNCGRTALHLAAYQGLPDCISLLISAGAVTNIWDSGRKVTPLHCAASRGCVACVRILLKSYADVNAGLSYRSALHYAVQSDARECVKELLEAGACPNTPQIYTETPLHVAAAMGFSECIKLLLEYGADVRVQYGIGKITPLHLAAEDENAICTKLLIDAGASINATNSKHQTPLHLASLSQSAETLELLIKRGADPNVGDKDGRTPLHGAIVKVSRSYDCVRLLLNAGAKVNKPDVFGYTPIHIAALNEFSNCVMLLINHGGDVTAKTNGGISALSFIVRRTPDVLPKYISKLDSSITLTDHEIGDVDCELKLDFRILVPCIGRGETELLLNFIEVGQREILKHPLCETFLFLKWKQIRKFFIFSLFYHTLFVILFTIYIKGVFLKNCPNVRSIRSSCEIPNYIICIGYTLLVLNCLSLAKEIFQIAHNWKCYIRHWENWLQWLIIICVFLCDMPGAGTNITTNVASWQHHIAAIGIFLAWLELMMIVGRFPIFGLYVQMFTTVAMNFSKFLLAYCCLLIAFGLSFGVLFANYKAFKDIWVSLLKVIIMMSGELEFEDLFYEKENVELPYAGTAHVLYLAFVLLVTIILNNLIVGLAVSDIQGLQMSAGLDRLVRQAELMAHLESMLFSSLLNCIPKKLLTLCHKQALLLTSHYHWELYIRPNDPRENRIPKAIIQNVYKLVAERKEKCQKGRSKKSKYGSNRKKDNIKGADSNRSINRSYMETMSLYHLNTSTDNLSNFKNQVMQLADEMQKFNVSVQQRLNQLSTNFNTLR